MILIDFNQVALNAMMPFQNDLKKSEQEARNLIRHVVLSTILNYKGKYSDKYGEIVICCDGRNYWRTDIFPYYKGDRKKNRDKSDINWALIFDVLSEMRTDLKEIFPYRVIHLDNTEADDIIAVLAEWSQTNDLVQNGLYEEPRKMMIVSGDGDFLQLQKWDNISQYSPLMKKQLTMSKRDLYEKYITHIVKASDDGIPNILSSDDCIITEGKRQTPVSAKRLAEFLEHGKEACRTDEERRNWDRNERLISFDFIPVEIKEQIIQEFLTCKPKRDTMKMMNYLMNNRCRLLLNDIGNF